MNDFQNAQFLCGNISGWHFSDQFRQVFDSSNRLKKFLGKEEHLIDEYLSEIFKALSLIDIDLAKVKAEKYCSDVLNTCRRILKGDKVAKLSQIYINAKKCISKHEIECEDIDTKVYFYASKILVDSLKQATEDFISEVSENISKHVNFDLINAKYTRICYNLGSQKIDFLSGLIDELFILSPVSLIFSQVIMSNVAQFMSYHCANDNKQLFQLFLPNNH